MSPPQLLSGSTGPVIGSTYAGQDRGTIQWIGLSNGSVCVLGSILSSIVMGRSVHSGNQVSESVVRSYIPAEAFHLESWDREAVILRDGKLAPHFS